MPDAVIREAIAAGLADPSLGSSEQWAAVEAYLDGRGEDPWPARWERIHARGSRGPTPCAAWLADDVAVAAPLMGAFTSHDTSIEHAVVPFRPTRRADSPRG